MDPIRLLFLTPYVPSRLRVRPYNLIKHLSQKGHRITAMPVCATRRDADDARELEGCCERVFPMPLSRTRSLSGCVRAAWTDFPLQALYCHSHELERRVELELSAPGGAAGRYDVVHVEHLRSAMLGLRIRAAPCVYDSVDCITGLLEQTRAKGSTVRGRLAALVDLRRTRQFEAMLMSRFDRVLVCAEEERRALVQIARNGDASVTQRISVLPNGVDLDYFRPHGRPRQRATLVYVGRMSYHANITAVTHLVDRIMPLVWARHPEARLRVVGADPARSIRLLAKRHPGRVEVTGYVEDVRPYLAEATVSVSPLVYAVGLQNKILEAMAMETAVVASPAACEGLGVEPGEHLLVGEDAERFAAAVHAVLGDDSLRQRLGASGRRFVEIHHDWRAVVARLEALYLDVMQRFRGRPDRGEAVGH